MLGFDKGIDQLSNLLTRLGAGYFNLLDAAFGRLLSGVASVGVIPNSASVVMFMD